MGRVPLRSLVWGKNVVLSTPTRMRGGNLSGDESEQPMEVQNQSAKRKSEESLGQMAAV